MLPRRQYFQPSLDSPKKLKAKKKVVKTFSQAVSYGGQPEEIVPVEDLPEEGDKQRKVVPNLVSSKLMYPKGDIHAPTLDIDFPVFLRESSTKGHFHLFIDIPLKWREYKKLLKTLSKVGIIEEGYYKSAVKNKATFLRKPDSDKPKHLRHLPPLMMWEEYSHGEAQTQEKERV